LITLSPCKYSQPIIFLSEREKVGGEKGGERRGVGSVVNLVRGFPSHCGKPIGFSIVAALSMPRSEGEKGEVTSL
jgi:hypothetical protein